MYHRAYNEGMLYHFSVVKYHSSIYQTHLEFLESHQKPLRHSRERVNTKRYILCSMIGREVNLQRAEPY